MQKATKIPSENLPRFFLTTNTIFYRKFSSSTFKSLAGQQTREQEDLFPRFLSFSLFRVSFSTFFRCLRFSIEIYFRAIIVFRSIRGKLVFPHFFTNTCNILRISNVYFSFHFISYQVVPKVAFFCKRVFHRVVFLVVFPSVKINTTILFLG